MSWLTDLFDAENERVSTQFALSIFLCITGFLAAVGGLVAWGLKLMIYPTVLVGTPPAPVVADIPPNLNALLQTFILQTMGGLAGAIIYRPKCDPKPPEAPGGQNAIQP